MKIWLRILVGILVVSLIGLAVWFFFFSGYLDKNKKYTYQDLQDMYDSGYADGSKKATDLQLEINELNVVILELEDEISAKNTRITQLETQLTNANAENEILTSDIENLETEIAELTEENTQLKAEIESLKARIRQLQEELLVYQTPQTKVNVSFYADNDLIETLAVRENGSILLDIEVPEKENYIFDGWTLNNEVIDITTYQFTEDVDLIAKYVIDEVTLVGMAQNSLLCAGNSTCSTDVIVFEYDNSQHEQIWIQYYRYIEDINEDEESIGLYVYDMSGLLDHGGSGEMSTTIDKNTIRIEKVIRPYNSSPYTEIYTLRYNPETKVLSIYNGLVEIETASYKGIYDIFDLIDNK